MTPRPRLSLVLALAAGLAGLASAQTARVDPAKQSARTVPDWIRDGVVYEVFTRNFSPEGTFAGLEKRLPELGDLGVTVLWLMPIHPTGQLNKKGTIGSPYAVRDFRGVNPEYGTPEDFKRLVATAHAAGLRVIIDLVANHTAWDNVLIESNPDFYTKDAAGKIIPPNPDWTDVADLNYDNPALRTYLVDTLKAWMTEYGVDGFRCDVAGEVPTDFWESVRRELQAVKADVFLLAEANKPELLVEAFDADYAWPFQGALNDVISNGAPASRIRETWKAEKARFPRGSLHLYFSDNHDEERAVARFGEKGALAAAALVFGLDGVPLLYNGQEVGDTTESGAPALFEKLPIFWGIAQRRPEFPRFFRQVIALRKAHPALRRGALQWLPNSDEDRVLSFLRADDAEQVLVVVNLSSRPFEGTLTLPEGATPGFSEITPDLGKDAAAEPRAAEGLPRLKLDAWGFRFFSRKVPH
jgi:glycosidase